ncbi:MAG TPA: tripartite tricarboxylate transporter substrate binding protein [Burkholderiales bacterium]|nr:tripartite tricarboxylate transporter substrate binding protein [Burkholderiales bacterium]
MNRNATLIAGAIAAAFSVAAPASAQTYPTKPVRVIVPFAPGGGTDVTTRAVSQRLTERLGNTFVVDNRGGANGVIGVDLAVKSPADGYTLVAISNSHTVNVSIYKKLSYDLVRDLAPIAEFTTQPFALVVNPSLPAKSVKELIAYARANPGKLNYGSSGTGGISHLSGAMFGSIAGIELSHVPYKGGTPAMIDVISGQIQMLFSTLLQANPHIKSGKLRVLAVTTPKRNSLAPELPTMSEAGVPGYDVSQWFGLTAPAKTPKAIVTKLNAEIVKILQEPEMKARIAADGAEPVGGTPEEFSAHIRRDIAKWAKVVKHIGLQAE